MFPRRQRHCESRGGTDANCKPYFLVYPSAPQPRHISDPTLSNFMPTLAREAISSRDMFGFAKLLAYFLAAVMVDKVAS